MVVQQVQERIKVKINKRSLNFRDISIEVQCSQFTYECHCDY